MLHQTSKSHSGDFFFKLSFWAFFIIVEFIIIIIILVFLSVDRLCIDDLEVEDDIPCPYCYEDHDIASLCAHLEDEHSFESRVAVRFCFILCFFYTGIMNFGVYR